MAMGTIFCLFATIYRQHGQQDWIFPLKRTKV